jgi:lambda family phage portal protein
MIPRPTLYDYLDRPLPVGASASRFEGARYNRLVMDWVASSLGPNPNPWELGMLRDRTRDRVANDPIASSIPSTISINAVGSGLTPQSRLRPEVLGFSEEKAEELQTQAEGAFDEWQKYADAGGRLDFQEMQPLALERVIIDGEILANLPMLSDSGRPFGRAVELITGDRLATPYGQGNGNVFQGVELGEERKEPLRYWIRKAPKAMGDVELPNSDFLGIPPRDAQGRPMLLHIFATKEPGQVRGRAHFAPVLKYFKNLADSLDAEVVAQKVAACLSAVITRNSADISTFPAVTDSGLVSPPSLEDSGQKKFKLEPGMVPTLAIGEDIRIVDFKKGGETFEIFLTKVLRILGNAFGLPYELLLRDFSKTTYSSARAALLEGWRVFLYWRNWLTRKFCQPIWELVLEEAMLQGRFAVRPQDFYARRNEYCRADWIGPTRGWVDPVKEIVAAKLEEDYDYTTLADQCAAQGRDWENVLRQKAREYKRRLSLGLPIVKAAQVTVIVGGETTGEQPNAPQE